MSSRQESFVGPALRMLAENRKAFAIFVCLSVLGALTEGLGVSMIAPILDTTSGTPAFDDVPVLGELTVMFGFEDRVTSLQVTAIALMVIAIFRGVLQFLVQAMTATLPLHLLRRLCMERYSAVLAVEIGFFDKHSSGQLIQSINEQPRRLALLLTDVASAIAHLLVIAVYVVMMLIISWKVSLVAFAFVLFVSFVLRRYSTGPLRRSGQALTERQASAMQHLHETMTGMRQIRLSRAENHMMEMFGEAYEGAISAQRTRGVIQAIPVPFMTGVAGVFLAVLLFMSTVFFGENVEEWLAQVLLFLFLLMRLLAPVSSVNQARTRIQGNLHAFHDTVDFLRACKEARQPNGSVVANKLQTDISFEDVQFSYGSGEEVALHDFSLTIPIGKTTAIVGSSGAGKSTVIALLTRLYDPTGGCVRIDGHDLRDLDVQSWRGRIAVVSQDIVIFNESVRHNLTLGRADIDDATIVSACKKAVADEFIQSLPNGYDTRLGEHGTRLSGGQQQRLAIARAILADPDLLILDEATSNLDTLTESAIQQALDEIGHGRTVLVVAHRLSTIKKADSVVVMKEGRIVERGDHYSLLARKGIYWEMVDQQRLEISDQFD